jgi:hypothetical protein
LKNKFLSAVLVLVVGVIAFFIWNQLKQTTFEDYFFDQLTKDTTITSISIAINEVDGHRAKIKARTTIEDTSLIQAIADDFTAVEMKESEEASIGKRYTVGMNLRSKVSDDHFQTSTLYFDVDHDFLNIFEITSSHNHLQTIESIITDDQVEWDVIDD